MDFAFSEEQEMLRAQARSFLADRFPPERVTEVAEAGAPWDADNWKQVAELGWIGLALREDQGGAGMTFLEEAVLLEEMGRVLFPGPFLSTVVMALPALAHDPEIARAVVEGRATGTVAVAEAGGPYNLKDLRGLGTKAERVNGTWMLTGEKHLVPDLAAARWIVVVAEAADGVGLWVVDGDSAGRRELSTMDTTRPFGVLELAGTEAALLVRPGAATELLEGIRQRTLVALALEAVGVAQQVLDLAVSYVGGRVQFDKPIGTYQAVSHPLANTYMETELARSTAYWAAWCVATDDERAAVAASAAKAIAGESAVAACERSIQAHGGIGFTWEHILHRYYKRAQWIDSFEGFGAAHRAALAAALLDD